MHNSESSNGKRPAESGQAVETLLCLLASYETYGTGQVWPSCLRRLSGAAERP